MFHSSNPTLFGRPEGVLGETEGLSRILGGLRRVSHALSGSRAEATIEARRLLASLSTSLVAYFDAKEAKGYFAAIVAECPALVDAVGKLGEAREQLKLSVTSVRRQAFRSTDTAELGRTIREIIDGFEAHESSERELLQSFFLAGAQRADSRSGVS